MTNPKMQPANKKPNAGKAIVTSGGVLLVDAAGAAKLLKASGVLASAREHMHFVPTRVAGAAGRIVGNK